MIKFVQPLAIVHDFIQAQMNVNVDKSLLAGMLAAGPRSRPGKVALIDEHVPPNSKHEGDG